MPGRDSAVSEPKVSRAGRDLRAAIGVGLGLGAVILITLFAYRPSFAVLVALAVGVGSYELTRAFAVSGAFFWLDGAGRISGCCADRLPTPTEASAAFRCCFMKGSANGHSFGSSIFLDGRRMNSHSSRRDGQCLMGIGKE